MKQDSNQPNTFRSLPLSEAKPSPFQGRAGREAGGGRVLHSTPLEPEEAPKGPALTLIAAVAENGAIGNENKLLYWLPNDLKRFKALTTGHTIVMGRRTYESLPKGALPNRRNLVLSKNAHFIEKNIEVFPSLEAALAACDEDEEVFVIGGASIYRQALPLATRLCLTIVHDTPPQADAFFPWLDPTRWHVEHAERHEADDRHALAYTFVDMIQGK